MKDGIDHCKTSQAREWIRNNQYRIDLLVSAIKEDQDSKLVRIHPELDNPDHQAAHTKQAFKAFILAGIVTSATTLLVTSSLDVFGDSWQGWLKAILLEIAILALAVTKVDIRFGWYWGVLKEIAYWLLSRGTLAFLLVLSFSVLHTGVESQRSDGLNTARSTSATLIDLINERGLWQKTHDDYPENRITDRRNAMTEISKLNSAIRTEREALPQSLDGSVISQKSNTEMMLRAALLLLNIIFGHKLVSTLATIKWPPIREVGARS